VGEEAATVVGHRNKKDFTRKNSNKTEGTQNVEGPNTTAEKPGKGYGVNHKNKSSDGREKKRKQAEP